MPPPSTCACRCTRGHRTHLILVALATLLPLAILAGIVGWLLVQGQRESFRRGAEERTLALLTAVGAGS